ncbi:MAG: hypothetical protein ACXWW0_04880, partial [Bacteroidia bacterium]
GRNKKQFAVWMDTHHATIAGRNEENNEFVILGHVENSGPDRNSSESAANNQEIALTHSFFKEIASKMQNIDEVHVTGTGQIQEEFINYLAETPQYKDAVATESTSNKMDDEAMIAFTTKHFN